MSRYIVPLVVLGAGLVATLVASVLVRALWTGQAFAALTVIGLASAAVSLWLARSGKLSKASFRSTLPRCVAASVGLAVLLGMGMLLPPCGLLWSPLPWEPRPYHLAQQKLFWIVGTPTYELGLWLLDQARLESLRLTDRRFVLPLILLISLATAALLTDGYLYAHLDHGQGG